MDSNARGIFSSSAHNSPRSHSRLSFSFSSFPSPFSLLPPQGDAPGTPVYEANQIYSQYFPDSASTNDLLILLIRTVPAGWPASDSSVLTPLCASVTSQVLAAALAYPDDPNMFRSLSGYFVYAGTNYSDLASEFVTADQTATMITVSYDANGDVNDFIHYFEDLVRGGGITYPSDTPPNVAAQYEMSITGLDLLFDDTVTGSEKDFITMDGVVLPVALIVLALYLRNLRMMVIPLASVGLTLLTSFTIMYPIALYGMTVASFAPSIMVSTAIALSIDYSLFLLTRYREERLKMIVQAEKKRMKKATMAAAAAASPNASSSPPPPSAPSLSPQEEMVRQNFLATKAMLRTAGHVVFVSGTTLMLTFMGLVFFPLSFLQSVGVGAAFALLMCLVVNLNLTPVLLLTFPGFFGTFRLVPQCLARRMGRKWTERIEGGENVRFQRAVALAERHAREEEERKNGGAANGSGSGNGVLLEPSSSTPLTEGMLPSVVATDDNDDAASSTGDGMDRASLLKKQAVSFWFRSATFTTTTRYSFLVIFFVLALSLPFSYFTLELKTSSDVGLIFPRNSLALAAFQELNARFRPGFIDPFHVIAVASQSGKGGSRDATKKDGCWNEDFFLAQQGFIQGLVAGGLIANDSVTAISYFKGNEVSFTEALAYLDPSSGSFDSPAGYLYRTIVGSSLNADRSVTLMNLVTSFNPDGDNGPYWVDTVRGMLSLMQQQAAAKGLNNAFYLNGGATDDLDSYRKVNSLFPTLVALTVCCVFLIVAVLFRSFLVPLRLLFTIGLSITFVYGFAVLVFQRGMFDWLSANLRKTNTIFWMETIMTFSILTGLGLDYDVFLFSRVRVSGWSRRVVKRKRGCVCARIGGENLLTVLAFVLLHFFLSFFHLFFCLPFPLLLFLFLLPHPPFRSSFLSIVPSGVQAAWLLYPRFDHQGHLLDWRGDHRGGFGDGHRLRRSDVVVDDGAQPVRLPPLLRRAVRHLRHPHPARARHAPFIRPVQLVSRQVPAGEVRGRRLRRGDGRSRGWSGRRGRGGGDDQGLGR